MKKILTYLLLFIWLPLSGQPNQRNLVQKPILNHTQAVEMLLKKNVPDSDILKMSLKMIQAPSDLRSVSAQKQKLDSIVATLEKEEYAYDANQNRTLYINMVKDTVNNRWVKNEKEENSYNTNGSIKSTINSIWNDTTHVWEFKDKTEYTYDVASGNMASEINSLWNDTTNVWDYKEKTEYAYDVASKRMTSMISYAWVKALSQWRGSSKNEMTYDANGNVTLYIGYKWDLALNNWVYARKDEYTFNAQKQTTMLIFYKWDKTKSKWVGQYKEEHAYNTDGNITLSISSERDTINDVWLNESKSEYTYNDKKQNTQIINSDWVALSSTWVYNYKTNYEYDAQGNEIYYLQSTWDTDTNQWVNSMKEERIYDAKGNTTMFSYSYWVEGEWVLMLKSEYTYNVSGQLIAEINSDTWLSEMNSYMSIDKTEYSYDGSGNAVLIKESAWSMMSPVWTDESKEERTYNNSFSYADLVLPHTGIAYHYNFSHDYGSDLFNHMLNTVKVSYYDQGGWIIENDASLYYSAFSALGISAEIGSKIAVYPNPASDFITIRADENYSALTVEIYDLTGKLILREFVTNQSVIPIRQVASGLYMVRIKTGDQLVQTVKLFVK